MEKESKVSAFFLCCMLYITHSVDPMCQRKTQPEIKINIHNIKYNYHQKIRVLGSWHFWRLMCTE